MDNKETIIKNEVKEFCNTHEAIESWQLINQLVDKYNISLKDSYNYVSTYLSSLWK